MKKKFSLRVSILSLYLTTFILIVAVLIALTSINFYQSMSYVSRQLILNTNQVVVRELALEISPALAYGKITKQLLESGLIEDKDLIEYTYFVAKNLPTGYYSYPVRKTIWGDVDGNNVSTVLETNKTFSTTIVKPNDKSRIQVFRDATGKVIRKRNLEYIGFDPRTRLWYLQGETKARMSWTDVYFSQFYNNPTTTLSIPIYDQQKKLRGVFGIDIKLIRISQFLSTLKIGNGGQAFIFNKKGHIIAHPELTKALSLEAETQKTGVNHSFGKPWLMEAYKQYQATHNHSFTFNLDGHRYIAAFQPIPAFANYGWIIAVVVPEEDFIGALKKTNRRMMAWVMLILCLGVLVTYYLSIRISEPIKSLVAETDKIKMFVFDNTMPPDSVIQEVHQLSLAIYSMKMNLHSFEKYIPQKLVRQLIQTGEDSVIGGTERQITILFSDIQNFTHIAEAMSPENLMIYLCEYLEALSTIITSFGGTIDKYMGDSIMAFWGAPLPDEDHCQKACHAAVECQQILNRLNFEWEQQGKTKFVTRIGIHTGKALVGNVGSQERLNYTVLGDSINLANRLEKINKVYGTKIIVSEMVKNVLGPDFTYRFIDHIRVRGKTQSYYIYELLLSPPAQLAFDLHQYSANFEVGFNAYAQQQWDKAIFAFNQCLEIYPDDTVAPVFMNRCEKFKKSPTMRDWDGTWTEF
jgi:adenylate cyclase